MDIVSVNIIIKVIDCQLVFNIMQNLWSSFYIYMQRTEAPRPLEVGGQEKNPESYAFFWVFQVFLVFFGFSLAFTRYDILHTGMHIRYKCSSIR